jgi:hypothetical protein
MIVFNFDLRELEDFYNVHDFFFQLDNNKAIIDNELMNDISPDWKYEEGKICCTGILYDRSITIYIAEESYDLDFKNEVSSELVRLSSDNLLFAFNKFMENGNFKGDLSINISINEIKPFNAKGWNKERFFKELKDNNKIPDIDIFDPFYGDSGLCVNAWKDYLQKKDLDQLKNIVAHNLNCLLKEAIILKHRQYFRDNWEIDDKNFMLRKKDE